MIKVGGIQNTQVLWQAVFLAAQLRHSFLAAPLPTLNFVRTIPPATQATAVNKYFHQGFSLVIKIT